MIPVEKRKLYLKWRELSFILISMYYFGLTLILILVLSNTIKMSFFFTLKTNHQNVLFIFVVKNTVIEWKLPAAIVHNEIFMKFHETYILLVFNNASHYPLVTNISITSYYHLSRLPQATTWFLLVSLSQRRSFEHIL